MGHVYAATVEWVLGDGSFETGRYSRAHVWRFDCGLEVPASASPLHVRLPYSREDAVDPEEAFVASLSSCHMLFFLFYAGKAGLVVERYRDAASGEMDRDESGRDYVARVALRPETSFAGEPPTAAVIADLHHQAHEACFIANSVRSVITIDPVAA
jgi:organic hydroperoxide reductase OsmC/OhrA